MAQTFGHFLLNEVLPEEHKVTGSLDKKALRQTLSDIAQKDATKYPQVVSALKRLGDTLSTLDGISVGLDDIEPVYKERDAFLRPAVEALKAAKTPEEKLKIVIATQQKALELTKRHPGTMAVMAQSGARGNVPQLMKSVTSPIAAQSPKGSAYPWIVRHGYSEGLRPADYWLTAGESRLATIQGSMSTAEPGDLAKVMVNNLYPMVVTEDDCGTKNGVAMPSSDGHIQGRVLAKDAPPYKRGDVITRKMLGPLKDKNQTVIVRSPMTCEAHSGVCRACQGHNEKGEYHQVGENVGVRAAQALTEPLTQMVLSSKHGVTLVKDGPVKLEGVSGLRQLIEVPSSFLHKATLASRAGKVTGIKQAPHGGNYVYVDGVEHYAGPNIKLKVTVGQTVEAGDALSDGIPKPDEVTAHKGLGAGRQYMVDALHDLYKNHGLNMDKRHLELVARADLNYVQVRNHSDQHPDLLRGDIIPYARYRAAVEQSTRKLPLEKAEGHVLGEEVFHFTVGTEITPSIVAQLKAHGVKEVRVSDSAPDVDFIKRPMTRNPLLHPDWLARLSHRYLKDGLLRGAHVGDVSDIHGTHPVPAYAYGADFGNGPAGRY